jgi:1-acyl-sn-glycerol-3-phosphate acyltransferase
MYGIPPMKLEKNIVDRRVKLMAQEGVNFVTGAWISESLKRRRIHWLGKREMFDWPVVGWIGANGGIHPVDRDHADIEAFRLATRILEKGYVLLVFPEGTRSPTGELQEAKDGIAMLALRTGAQIVPVGINNTDAVWKKGRFLPSPFPGQTVQVRIGGPFRVQDATGHFLIGNPYEYAPLRIRGSSLLARRLRVERDGDDLTFNQLAALGTLLRHGPMPVGEMAGHENVKPPSMTRTVAALEEAGLVTRRPSATDGRQVVVELTELAQRVMDEDRARRTAWLVQRLDELSPTEVELLDRVAPLLERLSAS